MSTSFFLILLCLSMAAYLYISFYSSKSIKTSNDFLLADRSLGFWSVTMSLVGIQVGGGLLFGSANAAFQQGYIAILYAGGIGCSLVMMSIFGAKQLRSLNVTTVSEIFITKYRSIYLSKISSIISILGLLGIFIAQIIATREFFHTIGITSEYILAFTWLSITLYTAIGGIKSSAYTDILQISIVFFVFFIVLITLIKQGDIVFDANAFINDVFLSQKMVTQTNHENVTSTISPISLFLTPFFFCFIEQDIAQRILSAKNISVARWSAFAAGIIVMLFGLMPVLLGIAAQDLGEIPPSESIVIYYLSLKTNPYIMAVISIAVISIIVSTGDGLLCGITSNIVYDFDMLKNDNALLYTRLVTIAVGITGYLIARNFSDILEVLLYSYQLIICSTFVPIVFAYAGMPNSKRAAEVSLSTGIITYIVLQFVVSKYFEYQIPMLDLASAAVSAVAFITTISLEKYYSIVHSPKTYACNSKNIGDIDDNLNANLNSKHISKDHTV